MTLAMSLVILGLMTVYQLLMVTAGAKVPAEVAWVGGGTTPIGDTGFGFIPNSLLVFVPLALLILWGLRRSGFGRLLYAVGDNERAARLSGVRVWQVLLALYILSALLAGVAGLIYVGVTKVATVTLVDKFVLTSVAAAVIGGTSIFGGRGGYAGTHRGRADPDRPDQPADRAPDAGGSPPDPVRRDRARGGRGLHPHHRGVVTG